MKILLTGANGYIGKRLLPLLLNQGYHVFCCVRDPDRFAVDIYPQEQIEVLKIDFLDADSVKVIPDDIDVAYYLIHSLSASTKNFDELEKIAARNFSNQMQLTSVTQVIYLSGIANQEKLSRHLSSRKEVEEILQKGSWHLTTLRAGIVIGSGSASFEIMRDLVEKLPVMIAPRWLSTKSQPIAMQNVMEYMMGVLANEKTYDQSFDIGGPDVLTYKEMLLQYASARGLRRWVYSVPVMSPRLSSYWLYFITSTSYKLAVNLVNSMKIDVVCRPHQLGESLNISLISYKDAVKLAIKEIEDGRVTSSWIDALSGNALQPGIARLKAIPEDGCLSVRHIRRIDDPERVWEKVMRIGGSTGWYFATRLWAFRGFLDKMVGGVGLRRGRKNQYELQPGETLDFWRVVDVNQSTKRLLLYAEMKLPGDAWLEFEINGNELSQTAIYKPKGIMGILYWYMIYPFHDWIFRGMVRNIAK
ncbi:SDR family oxidoreductase [Alkalitalea saponilacus]|uniref:Uncharacterized conserved protein YbjT, contains NAD(P)-binding and DUF2867 domains n=1 Tax=Alkalitalea saponilacus TaxID=889453 RepID=A0A1T5E8T0_9BACT|nr:SDR family oxidoreductase [Alkalitalea saponilacus]ASB49074.1 epimerase [Alkalitalea saponilacus]SKB80448.1 Uncharacterized conserved protein YbjT, contains NAD(P)-binding and DUF2867 domains [Alkalitalea saponilacus]